MSKNNNDNSNDIEIKNIYISTSSEESLDKKKNSNEDIFFRSSLNCDQENNRTALFLAKINAHITSNLCKSNATGGGGKLYI